MSKTKVLSKLIFWTKIRLLEQCVKITKYITENNITLDHHQFDDQNTYTIVSWKIFEVFNRMPISDQQFRIPDFNSKPVIQVLQNEL